jgi:hypothetical protein
VSELTQGHSASGPTDRGGWTALSAGTTRAEPARAAVEGVVFAVAAAAAGQQPGRPVEPRPRPEPAAALDRWRAERGPRVTR